MNGIVNGYLFVVGNGSYQVFNLFFRQMGDFLAIFGYGGAVQTINVFSANPWIVFDKRELGVAMNVFEDCIQRHHNRVGRADFNIKTVNSLFYIF